MSRDAYTISPYELLPPSLGGQNTLPSSVSLSALIPTPPGVTPPDDQTLHSRVRYRALLLDGSAELPHDPAPPSKRKARPPNGKIVLPKAEQKYKLYEPLRQLWNEYATLVLSGVSKGGLWNLGDRLLRMDLHGAVVQVIKANDVSLVGVRGILVAETANTIVVVMEKDRAVTVPKKVATIEICVAGKKFEIFLPALCYRASERSARKIKKRHFTSL